MTVVVTHSTPADGTFSAQGALAWDANHTLTGVGTMAEQNANAVAITGGTVSGSTITATTKFVSPHFDAQNSAGGQLRNASGVSQLQWGGGGGSNLSVDVAININPANAQVAISPSGTGHVVMKPAGVLSIEIAPTNPGTLNNMVIGGTTPLAITGTTITATNYVGVGGGNF
jgi:hypothetical protein